MKIVELKYVPRRTLNYMLPVLGGEQSDENDPGETVSPTSDEPSDAGQDRPEDADPSS